MSVAVLPEAAPGRSDLDARDVQVVEATARALVDPDADIPRGLARVPIVEFRQTTGPGESYHFRPLALNTLRARLQECAPDGSARALHDDFPSRQFFAFFWRCAGEAPHAGQISVIAIEDHRAVAIYHHANGAIPVWSPFRPGSGPGR